MYLLRRVCLYAVSLTVVLSTVSHGLPASHKGRVRKNADVHAFESIRGAGARASKRDDRAGLLPMAKRGYRGEVNVRDARRSGFVSPAMMLYMSSNQGRRDALPDHADDVKRRRRILDVITGDDCGMFGCGGGGNTNTGGFEYGYPDDEDDAYYGATHEDQPQGYWEDCVDIAGQECYYYYANY